MDILKHYDGEVIRFFLLSGHYRNPINFSEEMMEQAKNSLMRMRNAKANLIHLMENETGSMSDKEKEQLQSLQVYRDKFIEAMDDDLNTADAISAVFELIRQINLYVKDGCSKEFAEQCLSLLDELTGVLGLLRDTEEETVDAEIDALIRERQEARANKDFKRADEIRDLLKAKGIILKDTPQGVQIIKE